MKSEDILAFSNYRLAKGNCLDVIFLILIKNIVYFFFILVFYFNVYFLNKTLIYLYFKLLIKKLES